MTKRKIEYWVIPPEADGEFVAHMEEVLETYEKAYDPAAPVLCMDEQPVQLLKETRQPKTIPSELIMSTNAPVRRAFSCLQNRYPVFARRRLALSEQRWIGLWKSRPCSTHDTPTAIGLHWFATT
jgi:hypothetical protein